MEDTFCAPVSVRVYHSFVITRLNSGPLLMALVHPPVEKSQFWLQSKRCSIRQGGYMLMCILSGWFMQIMHIIPAGISLLKVPG